MLSYHNGNLFDSKAHALVIPVNCVGAMGKGVAKRVTRVKRFSGIEIHYRELVSAGMMKIGRVHVLKYKDWTQAAILFPTKTDWVYKSELRYIDEGLKSLVEVVDERRIRSVGLPWLGCGLGGLDMGDVEDLFEEHLRDARAHYMIYTYKRKGSPS